ncbi:SubName: Full=Uncharacterized protein {ECO:0000313/EMBL:CCA74385.1} [Serendipita indica DSM 11827]|nr:SubName: Full=Uncharacterized protein {ECO:0000313/EMBL:CCA74385.1} [Serendipita indica DSM 11827]
MQVNEVPTSRPLSVPGRDLVGGGATYDGVSSSYLGDGGKSPWPRDTAYDSEEKAGERPNPHRKYSKKWFDYARNRAVEVGRWPQVTYASIGIILIVVWVASCKHPRIVFAKSEVKAQGKTRITMGVKAGSVEGLQSSAFAQRTLKSLTPLSATSAYHGHSSTSTTLLALYIHQVKLETGGKSTCTRDVKAVPEDRQGNATLLAEFDLTQAELERIV